MSELSIRNREDEGMDWRQWSDSVSATREYLDDKEKFSWGNGAIYRELRENERHPLIYIRHLDESRKSPKVWIDEMKVDPACMAFKYTFAVKCIRLYQVEGGLSQAQKEVSNMQDLRHPHVAILLGSFLWQGCLHILIYPAATCDLGDLLKLTSDDMVRPTGTVTSATTLYSNRSNDSAQPNQPRATILQQDLKERLSALKGYFICLSRGLQYLHSAGLRHKDIKPENILIDYKGYILFTDFGISKRFEDNMSHVTDDGILRTPIYQSPERAKGQQRGDPDDVFSLGCVFLLMASLILGKDWEACRQHFQRSVNETGKVHDFCRNLDKIDGWVVALSATPMQEPYRLPEEQLQHVVKSLDTIRLMLSEVPYERPKAAKAKDDDSQAKELWEHFDFPNQRLCRDCHHKREERWKPNDSQIQETEKALRRRSQVATFTTIPGNGSSSTLSPEPISQPNYSGGSPLRPSGNRRRISLTYELRSRQRPSSTERNIPSIENLSGPPSLISSLEETSSFFDARGSPPPLRASSPLASTANEPRRAYIPKPNPTSNPISNPTWSPTSQLPNQAETIRTAKFTTMNGPEIPRGNIDKVETVPVSTGNEGGEVGGTSVHDFVKTAGEGPTPASPSFVPDAGKIGTTRSDTTVGSQDSLQRKGIRRMLGRNPKASKSTNSSSSAFDPPGMTAELTAIAYVPTIEPLSQQSEQQILNTLGLKLVFEGTNLESLGLGQDRKVLLCDVNGQKVGDSVIWKLGKKTKYRVYKLPSSGNRHDLFLDGRLMTQIDLGELEWWTWARWRLGAYSFIVCQNFE